MKKGRKLNTFVIQITFLLFAIAILILAFILISNHNIQGFAVYESQPNATEGKDTYIRENLTANYGTATSLRIGKANTGIKFRTLIEFNLSSIPQEDTITSAVLQLYSSYSSTNQNTTIKIYRLTSSWEEPSTTWLNRTSLDLWDVGGSDFDNNEFASLTMTNNSQFYNLTISNLVRGWVNGTYPNYGLLLDAPSAQDGEWKEIYSSDYTTDSTLAPKITIAYTENAPPDIINISVDSNQTNPKKVGEYITFAINWSDLDSASTQTFVCNSSNISNQNGCLDKTFCNTSLSQTNPTTCTYSLQDSDNKTSKFYVAVCDLTNCSSVQQSEFAMNHIPHIRIIQPNGGETINQSQGNYMIKFNYSDTDLDSVKANIYYGVNQNSTDSLIISNLNLSSICTDKDSKISTQNNCSYPWNTTGQYGQYFITIIANDSYHASYNSSASAFDMVSLIDSIAPIINNFWLSAGRITSGKLLGAFANISEPNIKNVWISINTTPEQNFTLFNNSNNITFNSTFRAQAIEVYNVTLYATDLLSNINQTSLEFNVSKPFANISLIEHPESANPFSAIRISAYFNASDYLYNTSAYLQVPNIFLFLEGYPQNTEPKTYLENETNISTWFVSSPIQEGNYTFNVSYYDIYSNIYQSENHYISINYSSMSPGQDSYSLSLSGYPEVETSQRYFTEAYFKKNGLDYLPDSIFILLYDPLGNLAVGPSAMTNVSIGKFNFSYLTSGSSIEGQWQTIVNATKNSVQYYATHFWKLVGGPFDVRNIVIEKSDIPNLKINVTTENTGGASKDITLVWNLTILSNNTLLDAGAETFAVSAYSNKTWTVYPNTSYIGQVKITFLGFYSGTEKAGAFKIFSTTQQTNNSENQTPITPGGGSGGAGNGGGAGGSTQDQISPIEKEGYDITINAEPEIFITKTLRKTIEVEIYNSGKEDLTNVTLSLEGIQNNYYLVHPKSINKIKKGEKEIFLIEIYSELFTGENDFKYKILTNEIEKEIQGKIIVVEIKDFFLKEITKLNSKLSDIKPKIDDSLKNEFNRCENLTNEISKNIDAENYLEARDNMQKAEDCLQGLKDKTTKAETSKTTYLPLILIIFAILIIALIIAIYLVVRRKLSLISFMKKEESKEKQTNAGKKSGKEDFDKKLKEIEDKLKE